MATPEKEVKMIVQQVTEKYVMINILAQRARQLNLGSKSAIPYQEGASDPLNVALDELLAGKLGYKVCEPKP